MKFVLLILRLTSMTFSGLFHKTRYDRKNYDRISGVANYDAIVINYDVS